MNNFDPIDPDKMNELACALMDVLGIPHQDVSVHASDLYRVFMDEKRFKQLCARINNKGFW